MRATIAFVALLGACGGDGPKKRVPGGERASVASLIKTLDALREADSPAALLAEGVFEQCGKACACLDFGESGDAEARIGTCRDVWKDHAPPGAGVDWRAVYVAGAYLADQHDAADARDKKSLAAAMAALPVPIVPTPAGLGVAPAPATHLAGFGGGRHILTIDAQGKLRAGTGPIARLTPTGAVLAPAELKPLADTEALAAYVRSVAADAPPAADPAPPTVVAPPPAAIAPPPADSPPDDDDPQRARQQAIEQARQAGIMGQIGGGSGQYRMRSLDDRPFADAIGGARHSATGTDGHIRGHALVIVADRGAPGAKLVEAMALAEHAAIGVARGDELGVIAMVFRGARRGARLDDDNVHGGIFGGGLGGGGGWDPAELVIEVDDASFLVGNAAVRDFTRVDAADTAALVKALEVTMKDPVFADRRDVVVSVRDEARVAQVVAAVDAAVAAGARPVRVESWYDRNVSLRVRR